MSELTDPVRLSALKRSGILKYDLHERLERICYYVTTLLKCDGSQVNILTDTIQITVGAYPPDLLNDPIDVNLSGCRFVVLSEETIAIANTTTDETTCNEDWCSSFGKYLGTPIRYEGKVIGALCALGFIPSTEKWSYNDIMTIEGFADILSLSLGVSGELG